MKEGSEQVAARESKSCLPRLVIKTPSSLATVNLTLLLTTHTTQQHSAAHSSYKACVWLCSEEQERANRGMTMNELHVLHNPRRATDTPTKRVRAGDRGRERDTLEVFTV